MAIAMLLVPTIVSTTVRQVVVLHWALVRMAATTRPSIAPMVLAVALAMVLTIVPYHCLAWDWAWHIHLPHTEQVMWVELVSARDHRDRGDHPSRAARRATISSRSRPGTRCDVISCGEL